MVYKTDIKTLIKILLLLMPLFLGSDFSQAARIKDIANVRGVRANQLIGYGIVVGLQGTGDSKTEFTNKSIVRMLDKLGMKIGKEGGSTANVAAVIVTASLPPFARSGNKLDITVNSLGDAKSLRGGSLIQTPLRAADQQTYAVAQGAILVGGGGSSEHLTVGFIPNGAMIERDLGEEIASRRMFRFTLHNPDFTTSARLAKKMNLSLGGKYASALDGGTVDLIVPPTYEGRGVELIAVIESLNVNPDLRARVIVNEKTGTVVVGHGVTVSKIAISHGDLSLKVKGTGGNKGAKGAKRFVEIKATANVGELVQAMNRLGVSPKDLITILQSIKAAGALQGDLEIL